MKESILRDIDDLERSKENILTILRSYELQDLENFQQGEWSMIQVARHIQLSEDTSLEYMMKKFQAGEEMPDRGFRARLLLQVLFLVFRLRLKFKAPAVIANPPITSLEILEQDWVETRKKMRSFVEEYPDQWLNKALYKHPVVGRLSLGDAMRFFKSHIRHHTNQIYRIRKRL